MYSKTELTEIRKQIFPRYYGLEVAKYFGSPVCDSPEYALKCNENEYPDTYINILDFKLQLKPLSEITEEDAIWISEHIVIRWDNLEFLKDKINNIFSEDSLYHKSGVTYINSAYQYLQLKGYALPQLVLIDGKPITLSVEQQIESLIIETKN